MSAELKLKALAGGSLTLQVDDTLATDETMNISDGGIVTVTNANGTAVKFPDGTMICTKTITQASHAFGTLGSGYVSDVQTLGDYAIPFVGDIPELSINVGNSTLYMWAITQTLNSLTSFGTARASRWTSATGSVTYQLTAIGRWK